MYIYTSIYVCVWVCVCVFSGIQSQFVGEFQRHDLALTVALQMIFRAFIVQAAIYTMLIFLHFNTSGNYV
jgi:hypothetical protein